MLTGVSELRRWLMPCFDLCSCLIVTVLTFRSALLQNRHYVQFYGGRRARCSWGKSSRSVIRIY